MSKDILGLGGAVFVTAKTSTPDYLEGQTVQVVVQLLGGSLFSSPVTLKVFDSGTDDLLGSAYGTQEPRMTKTFIIECGPMPNHTLTMRVDLTTDAGTSSSLVTAQVRPPSVTVGSLTLDPRITAEEATDILRDAGVSEETIESVVPRFSTPSAPVVISEGEVGEPVGLPALPWYAAWLEPVLTAGSQLTEWAVNIFAPLLSPLGTIAQAVRDPFGSLSSKIGDLFTSASKASVDTALQATKDATSHTPDFATDLRSMLGSGFFGPVDELLEDVSKTLYGYKLLDPLAANGKIADLGKTAKLIHAQTFYAGSIAEAVSFGQFEALQKFTDMILGPYGLGDLAKLDIMLPLEPALITPAKQYWNSIYPNEIPSTQDLINMVVKEKIDIATFTKYMKYQGLNEEWSGKIWDAHFIAPSLGQLLTSWRRGHISDAELGKYEILVDLDPIYKTFWEDQRYVDPSLMSARFMFETGAITKDGVKDIVRRNGYYPSDVDALTNYVVTFQERLWRRRYIMAVASGYRQGVYPADFLTAKVLEAGYTDGVAHWMIETENTRSAILKSKVKPDKDVLVTLTIAIDAYVHNDVDDVWLRNYFYTKGYDPFEIELALKVYSRKKATIEAKAVSGTSPEGATASTGLTMNVVTSLYVKGDVTEDYLRTWFLGKGYSPDDTELYIKYWNNVKFKETA